MQCVRSLRRLRREMGAEEANGWWERDLEVLANVQIILEFAVLLAAVRTRIFIVEALLMHIYRGPGARIVVSLLLFCPLPLPY